ncbi:MAG: YggS family pyridoxal phosphate-dependent enzyme [Candidatus Omnitrophica bacterium]|nr:YggS family pyridoxal phosphate-dependent enzyme [Candidatus Omnitrophota bacterium]
MVLKPIGTQSISQRLEQVRARIALACQRSGRAASSVTLVGVTKTIEPKIIEQAIACGLRDLGENRVQEAYAKAPQIAESGVRWHLIGHLQRNKARDAVAMFDAIHSVDSLFLIEALQRQAAAQGRRPDVWVQVNVSGEATKFGCQEKDAQALALAIAQCSHLRLKGLMTIAPLEEDPERCRIHFQRLRALRDQLQEHWYPSTEKLLLSMGMTQDFEVAIEEEADFVRIGSAIFGARN